MNEYELDEKVKEILKDLNGINGIFDRIEALEITLKEMKK